jgi:ABC-type antimicrobial peptide transport system permease subunit
LIHRLTGEMRALLASMEPNLPIITEQTLEAHLMGPIDTQLRVAASVAAAVGLIGVLIAAVGIYGVTAYAVVRRTREIGIRIAMGAQRADVVRMVLRQGLILVAAGAGLGLLLAALAGRLLRGMLFGLPPLDPVTFGGAMLLFAAVGLAACHFPARHATRIAATDALRCE